MHFNTGVHAVQIPAVLFL
uniref:Uncharacterized protein n=1 Tax=Anguilla anguilla TaxID=7936 RepID=A0A0E9Q297_ANGAN